MRLKLLAGLGAALMMSASTVGYSADLVIFHNWSSPAEVAALNVLKSGFVAKGNTWTDLAIPHDSGASVPLINLVTGGNPPNVFLEANPGVYRDLMSQGLSLDLTQWYNDNGILQTFDGASGREIYKARVGGVGNTFSASPWVYGGKLFFLSEEGDTFVVNPGDRYDEVGKNSLGELAFASPAVTRDGLFIRTQSTLYRIR